MHKPPFLNSLLSNILVISLIQIFYTVFSYFILAFSLGSLLIYIILQTAFSTLMFFWLLKLKKYFRLENSTQMPKKVMLANQITLFRLMAIPACAFLVYTSNQINIWEPTAVWLTITFFTDFIDGKVARKLKQISEIGKMMDSATDYLIIFITSILLSAFHIIPIYFTALVMIRGFSQLPNVINLYNKNKEIQSESSILGKVSVFFLMCYFGLEVIFAMNIIPAQFDFTQYFQYFVAFILVISTLDKLFLFGKKKISPK